MTEITQGQFVHLAIQGFGLGFGLGFMLWGFSYVARLIRNTFAKAIAIAGGV